MRNTGLDEAQDGIKTAGRNINNPRYADDTTLMAESEEELKSLLMKVKEESEKVGLKLNIQKMKIMASGPITSWEIDGETVETVADFVFLGSKITADGDCSHEIKRLLGRKVMTNLDSTLKSRDITLPTKVHLVKAMVFPVVVYGCESWTVKKVERQRIDAFELCCWRRLLRVPWTARRSVLGVHWKDWCWSWNYRTLATFTFTIRHIPVFSNSCPSSRWCHPAISSSVIPFGSWRWTDRPGVLRFMGSQSRTRLSVWTELTDTAGQKTRQGWQFWAFQKILCEHTATQGANGTGSVYVVLSHRRGAYESASFRLIT